jgi:hypothetical protein
MTKKQICSKCVLPAAYPGITFDQNGICNYCNQETLKGKINAQRYFNSEAELIKALEKYKHLDDRYDVLVPVSGGVDSSYALINIVEKFKLRPLVFHNDHGFEDETAVSNVKKLCKTLKVDLIIWQYELDFMKKLFKYFNEAQVKNLSACHACGNMLYFNALEMADRFNIKLVINGYSKGQAAFMEKEEEARQLFGQMLEIIAGDHEFCEKFTSKYNILNKQRKFLSKQDLEAEVDEGKIMVIPFYIFKFYKTHKQTLKKVCQERFDWQQIKITYPNRTTNCEMIWLNTYVDLEKSGYSIYQEEYSSMIRAGDMTRKQALSDLAFQPPPGLIERLAREVGVDLNAIHANNHTREKHEAPGPPGAHHHINPERILLAVLPFWTPLIPPLGISYLKSYLQKHGYEVKTAAVNNENKFITLYNRYFNTLKQHVPESRHGNFYSIGHFVLQNHMIAHNHYQEKKEYIQLVKILIKETYYTHVDDPVVLKLNNILCEFFTQLERYLIDLIEKIKPAVLGLTVNKTTLPASMFAFKCVRERYPSIKTIMGGPVFADHLAVGTPNYDVILEKTKDYIDKIIIGQGEILLLKLLRGELPKSQRVFTLKDINNEVLDFSALDLPDLSGFPVWDFPYLPAQGSIGCDYNCSFCSQTNYFGRFRKKDVKQTVREMMQLNHMYGGQLFFMTDTGMNPIITDLAREFIKSGTSLYWDGYLRVDDAGGDIENTLLWRRGGYYRARLGVESGSQHVLGLMNKEITVEQTKAAITSLAYAGIKTTTYWVVGHPGETEADFRQTLDLLEELKDDIWQAECAQFDYYYAGQSKADEWADKRMLLYPETAKDMLLLQTWILNCQPSRQQAFDRLFRFVERCKQLGIPNPYSMKEIAEADERWKKLHKNAVPPLLEFQNRTKNTKEIITENKQVKSFNFAKKVEYDDNSDFAF